MSGNLDWDLLASPRERTRILQLFQTIAVVGLSPRPHRPSHVVSTYMSNHGYEIIPVNPNSSILLGRECFPTLTAIERPIDIVNIFRAPEHVLSVVKEAIDIGAKVVWLQLGVIHEVAARLALDAGLEVVMDRCIQIEHMMITSGHPEYETESLE